MSMRGSRGLAAILLIGAAVGATPEPDPDVVRTKREVVLRQSPAADSAPAFTVASGTDLIRVAREARNGFYRVIRRERGPQAWISTDDVAVTHEATDLPPAKACAATLQQCPAQGCEEENTPAAESNELKRRQPHVGVPVTLSFEDLSGLQRQADERIGQGPFEPTHEQRAQLRDLAVKHAVVAEGDLVRVVGFIARGDDGLHVNKAGESVNCQLKKPTDNDIHIPLVDAPGNTEYHGIVAEMIPQDRPGAWSVDALKEIQSRRLKVWVEGALSYDKVHFVNDDDNNPIKDEPARMSLWEIHPVTKFLVCRREHCDPLAEEDWTPLTTR